MIDALARVSLAASACFPFYRSVSRLRCISVFSFLYLSPCLCLVSYIISLSCPPSVYLFSLNHFSLPFQHVPIPLTLCIYNAFIDVSTLLVHCRHTLCCGLSCFLLLSAFSRSVTTPLRNVYSHEFLCYLPLLLSSRHLTLRYTCPLNEVRAYYYTFHYRAKQIHVGGSVYCAIYCAVVCYC